MTSEQNAVRKQRGWVMRLVRGGCYLAVSERKKKGKCCPLLGVHRFYLSSLYSIQGIDRFYGPPWLIDQSPSWINPKWRTDLAWMDRWIELTFYIHILKLGIKFSLLFDVYIWFQYTFFYCAMFEFNFNLLSSRLCHLKNRPQSHSNLIFEMAAMPFPCNGLTLCCVNLP